VVPGAARPGIVGEMARSKFLMTRKKVLKVHMLKAECFDIRPIFYEIFPSKI